MDSPESLSLTHLPNMEKRDYSLWNQAEITQRSSGDTEALLHSTTTPTLRKGAECCMLLVCVRTSRLEELICTVIWFPFTTWLFR